VLGIEYRIAFSEFSTGMAVYRVECTRSVGIIHTPTLTRNVIVTSGAHAHVNI
jgi:hypothetical protein